MTTVVLRGKIVALSPIHIGTGISHGTFMETRDYIPARAIRGMLGNYFKTFGMEKQYIEMMEKFIFKPAYPVGSVAMPLGAIWCKKCSRLIGWVSGEGSTIPVCPEDGNEGTSMGGLITKKYLKKRVLKRPPLNRYILTKTPIKKDTLRSPSKEDNLKPYHIEVLGRGATFELELILPSENVDEVKGALREAGAIFGVGGVRSRGLGLVSIGKFQEVSLDDYIHEIAGDVESGKNIAFVLNSPALFPRDNGKYLVGMSEDIAANIGLNLKSQKFVEEIYRGWDYASDVCRQIPLKPATGRGSTFVGKVVDRDKLIKALVEGIGEERSILGAAYVEVIRDESI